MSNHLYLIRTKFTDLADGHESFGWRMFDDHDQTYASYRDTAAELLPGDDLGFLKLVVEQAWGKVCSFFEMPNSITIDDHTYTWHEICPILGLNPADYCDKCGHELDHLSIEGGRCSVCSTMILPYHKEDK